MQVTIKRPVNYPSNIQCAIAHKRCLWRKQRLKPDDSVIKAAYIAVQYKYKQSIRNYEIKREQKILIAITLVVL